MACRTYTFKLMRSKRLKKLLKRIDSACDVYNHCIALHKRYYSLFGEYLPKNRLQEHLAKMLRLTKKRLDELERIETGIKNCSTLVHRCIKVETGRKKTAKSTVEKNEKKKKDRKPKDNQSKRSRKTVEKKGRGAPRRTRMERLRSIARWETVGSQSIQQVAERIHNGYKLFFDNVAARKAGLTKRRVSPPTFKSKRKYKSFTRKCTKEGKGVGWSLRGGNTIRIGDTDFRFHKSREIAGTPKTMTVKRDRLGDVYVYIVCEHDGKRVEETTGAGNTVGFDFGLKTFLVGSDGSVHVSPQFFKKNMNRIRRANRELSRKKRGSKNRERARLNLARKHKYVANCRRDHHFKLARELCGKYSLIALENLNMSAMKSLWGRKVSDLGFADFVLVLKWTASKFGVAIVEMPRFYPSSKTCSSCGHVLEKLDLREREWTCPLCDAHHDRDFNAAVNILRVGASTCTRDGVRPVACDGLPSPVS